MNLRSLLVLNMAASSTSTSVADSVNFLFRAMVERDPKKRRVKPVDRHMLQLDFADLDDSSDDSDYKVTDNEDEDSNSSESKANSDDNDNEEDSDDDNDSAEDEDEEEDSTEDSRSDRSANVNKSGLTVAELIELARIKQSQARQRIATQDIKFSQLKVLICAVCIGDISEENDEIVECDGCGVSVHEGCYGISDSDSVNSTISSSSTEPWFCEACKAGNKNPTCELCPNRGGIFKETDVGKWVHMVCALYIPGVAFGDVDKLSPVTLFEMPYSKWGAKPCVLCEDEIYSRTGVCICCDAGLCRNYFHATCAQREGLLSEASPEEDIADPFFAYCKLHADKTIVRSKRQNWLALQSQVKRRKESSALNTAEQNRINQKLERHKVKYLEAKATKPQPWVPTQKMPRMLTSSPSACRKLIQKTELMGLYTQAVKAHPLCKDSVMDIRKKWHITPAFSLEFVSYFLDRNDRMTNMQAHLDELISENSRLQENEQKMRETYEQLLVNRENLKFVGNELREQGMKLWKMIHAFGGKKHDIPDILLPVKAVKSPSKQGRKSECDNSVTLNKCGICKKTNDQHLLAICDTCHLYYHLGCLDPPLTRLPKKTKLQGWQCSECDKTDDEVKEEEVDTNAPRRLREHIKEPAKFRISIGNDNNLIKGTAGVEKENNEQSTPETTAMGRNRIISIKKRALKNKKINKTLTATVPNPGIKRPSVKNEKSNKKKVVKKRPIQSVSPAVSEPPLKKSRKPSSAQVVIKTNVVSECCKCKQNGDNSNSVWCDECTKCYHFMCLEPPVKKSPKQRGYVWHCEDCDPTEEEAEPQVDKNNKPVSKKQKKEDASKALTSGLNQKKGREKKN